MAKISRGKALFDLVKSLNSKELRHFKLYTSGFAKGGDRQYQVVFDFMRAQPRWSEQDLRDMLAQQGLVVQLNVVFIYLHGKILESLRKYDTSSSFELIANRYMDEIAVLFKRKQDGYCLIQVKKARQFAQRMDLPHMELQLLQWDLRLLRGREHPRNWDRITALSASSAPLERKVQQETALLALYSRIFALRNWPSKMLPKDRDSEVKSVAEDPVMQANPATMGFDAALLHYNIRGLIAEIQQDRQTFAEANAHKIQLWKSNPERKNAEPERFFNGLFNAAESALEVGKFEYVDQQIKLITEQLQKHPNLKKNHGLSDLHLKLRMKLSRQRMDEAMDCIRQIPEHAEVHPIESPKFYLEICVNAAYTFFMVGIWSRCLEFLSRAESLTKSGPRMEYVIKAKPLRLMAMYAANDGGLEAAIKSWARASGDTPMGPLLAELFLALEHAADDMEKKAAFTQLLSGLDDISSEDSVLRMVRNWTRSRLDDRPIRDYFPPL